MQPGDSIVFESTEFSTPEALGFVPQDMNVFSDKLFVQALIQHGNGALNFRVVADLLAKRVAACRRE